MKLFDAHCHLEDERFSEDREETIARMREAGVSRSILAGTNAGSCEPILALTRAHPDLIYGVLGYHPEDAASWREGFEEVLKAALQEKNIIGIGEIGLDYYWGEPSREIQKEVLDRQLDLACELGVPAVFHVRDAHGDMLDLLSSRKSRLPAGAMHCFSGSTEVARQYLDMGFYISFAGPVTFKNAAKLPEVARFVPGDRIMVETDSPYLAPTPMRGKRNEPAYVRFVAETVARLREEDPEEFALRAYRNTCRLYGLEE